MNRQDAKETPRRRQGRQDEDGSDLNAEGAEDAPRTQ